MLEPMFQWISELAVSKAIGESLWIYPLVQAVHLVFLAILAGAILTVDLRLLNRGFTSQPVSQVARDARPWLIGGFIGMLLTGVPQLMQNAMRGSSPSSSGGRCTCSPPRSSSRSPCAARW